MNATIVRLSAQALLGRRRGLTMLAIPLVLLALTLVIRLLTSAGDGYDAVVGDLALDLALPLVALLATTAVLGPEIDDGSIVYLLAKPVSRHSIALSKYVVALLAALGFGAVPVLLAGLINHASAPERGLASFAGAVLASAAYSALFLALCSLTRHAVVAGLLFVFLWEGLMGNLLDGIRWLSVGAWAHQVSGSLSELVPVADGREVGLPYALVAGAVLVAGGVWFAGWRLRRFALTGET